MDIGDDGMQCTFKVHNTTEVVRYMRKEPPVYYRIEIDSLTSFQHSLSARWPYFDSTRFDVEEYKWILRIYPNGKEEDNGEDHVSLYLKLARSLDGCDVNATYKFFVYNYKRKMYLVVQGFEVQHFDDVEDIEHGISSVLSLNDFLNPSNGFILNGRCKFGVEVTVMRPTAQDACLLDLNVQRRSRFSWPIRNFTESLMYDYLDSRLLTMEGRRWFLRMYPRGHGPGFEKSISIYLHLCDFSDLRNGRRLYITMELRAKNLMNEPDATHTVFACYNISSYASGHCDLVALSDLHNSEKGFKLDDMLILEVELKQQYLLEDL